MIAISLVSVFLLSAESLAFDPNTGELVKNAKCEKYHTDLNLHISELNRPKLEDKDAKPIKEKALKVQKEARDKGCNPDPKLGTASKFNPARASTDDRHAYVPSSEGEAGVPLNFDFIGMLGTLLGDLFAKLGGGNIFPKP